MKSTLWREKFWLNGNDMKTVGEVGNERVVEPFVQEKGTPREEKRRLNLLYIPWSSHGVLN
ncbi:MAG: hypothetical protein ACE1ZO_03655 [Nitrospirales bacterium]